MFSQNSEEKYIIDYFQGKIGNFLDIGAYDGKTFSNTYRLAELNWSGVCIEPCPFAFSKLLNIHGKNSKIKLLNCALNSTSEIQKFYTANGDSLSTFSNEHINKWKSNFQVKFTEFYVKTITFSEIFKHFGSNFDFINIDVEGINYKIFNLLYQFFLKDQKLFNHVKLLCIEHDGFYNIIEKEMNKIGFKKIHLNGENIILGKTK